MRPPNWPLASTVAAYLAPPVVFMLFAGFAPRESSLRDALFIGVGSSLAVFLGMYLYLCYLRPWLGTLTAAAAVSLLVAFLAAGSALLSSSCPTGSGSRCSLQETSQTAFAGFLIPVALIALAGFPYFTYRTLRRLQAIRAGLRSKTDVSLKKVRARRSGAAQSSQPVHDGRVTHKGTNQGAQQRRKKRR